MEDKSWSVWQLVDSILPTGGLAHSMGLEAAVQLGYVQDSTSLHRFTVSTLHNSAALLLPFVFAAVKDPSIPNWKMLDSTVHAHLSNQVARQASIAQGTALLRVSSSVFLEIPELKQMKDHFRESLSVSNVEQKSVPLQLHHAPLFGSVFGFLKIDPRTAQRAFLYVTLRDLLSAATRLNIVGPLEAAYMQHELTQQAESLLAKYSNRPIHDAHQTVPTLDVIQGVHDNLFSRLFRS